MLSILSFFIYTTTVSLILSKNPVHSVLKLILIFFLASLILLLFGADFIGLLLIIIYVGAIAVLFLFIIMMLDLKEKAGRSLACVLFVQKPLSLLVFVENVWKNLLFYLSFDVRSVIFFHYQLFLNFLNTCYDFKTGSF